MNRLLLFSLAFLCFSNLWAQESEMNYDSLESSFTYEYGTIQIGDGIGVIKLPAGFKYLNAEQSNRVLVDLWGNPEGVSYSLGFILREDQKLMDNSSYVFDLEYDEIGYVKDDDAEDIDYEELLEEMKKETEEANKERVKEGYGTLTLVGWASKPFYDSDRKILHWAKELKFSESDENTLNYNIRILGRKGVLIVNAIASANDIGKVKKDIPLVLDMVKFNKGYAYSEFNPEIDEVAAWTIGGLVAGKLLAKAGFLAVILKFWKLIAVGAVALFGGLWKRFRNKREENPELPASES